MHEPVALIPAHDDPDAYAALHAAVLAGLVAHNQRFVPPAELTPLSIAARDAGGALLGGVVGHTTWAATGEGWLYVDLLWVDDAHRGSGLGSRLLAAAEAEAERRGCRHAYLSTFAFQARPFYERHGYAVFGVQEDYPPGSRRYWMRRAFGGEDVAGRGQEPGSDGGRRADGGRDGGGPV